MKLIIALLSFLNAAWMLVDGIFVLVKGKYIGPEKPGPWAELFYKLNINVFKLGPLFIFYGFIWFVFLYALWENLSWANTLGLIISALTLWYLPVGTLVSIVIFILLFIYKNKFNP